MGKKQIRSALVEGATQGLASDKLYAFVRKEVPDASNRKIVHTAFLTLTEPDLKDRNILNVIYGLAIDYRLGGNAATPKAAASSRKERRKTAGQINGQKQHEKSSPANLTPPKRQQTAG